MNYFVLQSCIEPYGYLCDDHKCRQIEDAVAHDCLMTFSSKMSAEYYAECHDFTALDVADLRDIQEPEAIEGLENYLEL